jgi:Cellulase (glycosyl hydrolase family 5)
MRHLSAPTGRLHVARRTRALVQRLRVKDGFFRDETGTPIYLVGANFWPKRTGPWMYRDPWDAAAIGADLRELASLGANAVRLFCFVPDFMPTPDAVAAQPLNRLEESVGLAAAAGLWSIPTFLVGHMSGENWTPDWGKGRDWYTDPLALQASELLVRTIARRFAGDARIAAWLLTNEWPLYAGRTSDEHGLRWAKRLSSALREADPSGAVSLGDGAWDVIGGERSGLPSRELLGIIDFYGPHFYPKSDDALRQSAFASFAMRMLQPLGAPVLLEEFGCSSDQADDRFAADYYRTTLWSAFGAGNCGALFWNSHDFTVADRLPYAHHPYELHFGVLRVDGSRKPQADEVARFATFARRHDATEWEPVDPAVAIGRSTYYLTEFPFDWGWPRPVQRDLLLQTYASLLRAGLDTSFIDLGATKRAAPKVLFLSCLQALTTQDSAWLTRFVNDGGTLYLSLGGEPWYPQLGELIGARPLIRYGLYDAAPACVELRFVGSFGDLQAGATLGFDVHGEPRRSAPLRCEAREASVLAVDADGHPALLDRRLGSGRVFFMAYPLEYYALGAHDANASDEVWRLHRAIARETGVLALDSRSPLVELPAGSMVQRFVWRSTRSPERRRLLIVNHGWEAEEIALSTSSALTDAETGISIKGRRLQLEAKAVRVVDLTISERVSNEA